MADEQIPPVPSWAAFDKDEDPPPSRPVPVRAVVAVVGSLLAVGALAVVLWPEGQPTRQSVAAEEGAAPLPSATASAAPTLDSAPPAQDDDPQPGAAGDGSAAGDEGAGADGGPADGAPQDPGTSGTGSAGTGSDAGSDEGTAPGEGSGPGTGAGPGPAPAPSDAPTAAAVTAGPLAGAATVAVPATSPDAVDGAGRPVGYDAANLLDGRPGTAWRADGDLSGEVVTLTFDEPRTISTAGLVNGYAKTDPATGADRYPQGRRVTRVTWVLDGQEVVQDLRDGVREVQSVSFPPVRASTVAVRIDRVTHPGVDRFDQTVVSEIVLAGG